MTPTTAVGLSPFAPRKVRGRGAEGDHHALSRSERRQSHGPGDWACASFPAVATLAALLPGRRILAGRPRTRAGNDGGPHAMDGRQERPKADGITRRLLGRTMWSVAVTAFLGAIALFALF